MFLVMVLAVVGTVFVWIGSFGSFGALKSMTEVWVSLVEKIAVIVRVTFNLATEVVSLTNGVFNAAEVTLPADVVTIIDEFMNIFTKIADVTYLINDFFFPAVSYSGTVYLSFMIILVVFATCVVTCLCVLLAEMICIHNHKWLPRTLLCFFFTCVLFLASYLIWLPTAKDVINDTCQVAQDVHHEVYENFGGFFGCQTNSNPFAPFNEVYLTLQNTTRSLLCNTVCGCNPIPVELAPMGCKTEYPCVGDFCANNTDFLTGYIRWNEAMQELRQELDFLMDCSVFRWVANVLAINSCPGLVKNLDLNIIGISMLVTAATIAIIACHFLSGTCQSLLITKDMTVATKCTTATKRTKALDDVSSTVPRKTEGRSKRQTTDLRPKPMSSTPSDPNTDGHSKSVKGMYQVPSTARPSKSDGGVAFMAEDNPDTRDAAYRGPYMATQNTDFTPHTHPNFGPMPQSIVYAPQPQSMGPPVIPQVYSPQYPGFQIIPTQPFVSPSQGPPPGGMPFNSFAEPPTQRVIPQPHSL